MYLFPYLPKAVAHSLATSLSKMDVGAIIEQAHENRLIHETALFAPTGGHPVGNSLLSGLQQEIRECASIFGYPRSLPTNNATKSEFDLACADIIWQHMKITPSEASNLYMWAHLTCVVLPDVVQWRFQTNSTDSFLGRARGRNRNAFGRLWWRSYIFLHPDWKDPLFLLKNLDEDNILNIVERPSIAGNRELAQMIGIEFLQARDNFAEVPSRFLLRDTMKRINRLLPLVSFEALDPVALKQLLTQLFKQSAEALMTQEASP